jgi:hypothetical protein
VYRIFSIQNNQDSAARGLRRRELKIALKLVWLQELISRYSDRVRGFYPVLRPNICRQSPQEQGQGGYLTVPFHDGDHRNFHSEEHELPL